MPWKVAEMSVISLWAHQPGAVWKELGAETSLLESAAVQ